MDVRAPTDAFIARLVEGGVLDDGRVRVRHERGYFGVTDIGGPYVFEQPWTEELTRELAAVRAIGGDAALDAFVSAGGRARELLGELEPERARLAAVALEPAHVGALLEAHLRAGGTLYRMNHEGWDGGASTRPARRSCTRPAAKAARRARSSPRRRSPSAIRSPTA